MARKKGGGSKGGGGKSKTNKKMEKKLIEDKTFGLKNKNKSKRVQKYVNTVEKQVRREDTKEAKARAAERERLKAEKEALKAHEALVGQLTTSTTQPKVSSLKGVDPKTIVCDYHKRGMCRKGKKCRFSHDMSKVRQEVKIDLYTDTREEEAGNEMDDWDTDKLREVVDKKHGTRNARCPSKIVCRHFLKAIEDRQYGYFWTCPNGGNDCQYRHALPPDFVLQSQKKEMEEEEEDKPTIEMLIEEDRKQLETYTPVTHELFLKWKEEKIARKAREEEEKLNKQIEDARAGRQAGMSGRALFQYDASIFVDDEAAVETDDRRGGGIHDRDQEDGVDEAGPSGILADTDDESEEAGPAEPAAADGDNNEEGGEAAVDGDAVVNEDLFAADAAEEEDLSFSDDEE